MFRNKFTVLTHLRCLTVRWQHVEAVSLRSAQSTKRFVAQILTHVH